MDLSSGSQHFPLELKSELQFSPLLFFFFFLNSSSSEIIHFQVTSAPLLFSHLHIALRFFFLSYFLPVSPQKRGSVQWKGVTGGKNGPVLHNYDIFFFLDMQTVIQYLLEAKPQKLVDNYFFPIFTNEFLNHFNEGGLFKS